MTQLQAVVFDWGGTLTPWHTIDLADLWSAAACVLAPDGAEPLTEALVQVEDAVPAGPIEPDAHITNLSDLLPIIDRWMVASARD